MNYLERIAEAADHIQDLSQFLADHSSNGGTYELEDTDDRELVRDLLHSITVDVQKATLLMEAESPASPWRDGPHYIKMQTHSLTPQEVEEHMRETLTPEEYEEWSKPPSPEEQEEMDQFEAEWNQKPACERTPVKRLRARRTDVHKSAAEVTPLFGPNGGRGGGPGEAA